MEMEPSLMEFRVPDPIEGPWSVRVWIGNPTGYPAIVGIECWGVEPKPMSWGDEPRRGMRNTPVTTKTVRELPLRRWLDMYLGFTRGATTAAIQQESDPAQRAFSEAVQNDLYVPSPKGGRKRLNPEFLKEVAGVYNKALAEGDHPGLAVAEWADVPDSTARGWIRKAGDQGFLPRGQPGKIRTEEST